MALFTKRSKMEKYQAVVAALAKRGELLAAKRVAAQSAFDAALETRQSHLLTGDLDNASTNERLQAKVDAASSALIGLDSAIAALTAQMNDAEQQLDAERRTVERRAAAEEIARHVADAERQTAPWLKQTREFVAALQALGHVYEVGQVAAYLSTAVAEIEVALAVTLPQLHGLVAAVAAGDAPIPHRPEPVVPVTVVPPAPTQIVFALRSVKWRDENGVQQVAGKFKDAYLPPSLVAKAIKCGACTPITDPRRVQLHNTQGDHPRADLAFDLDADPAQQQIEEPIERPSPFTSVSRGAPYQMKVAR
jgi:hypothetical protein